MTFLQQIFGSIFRRMATERSSIPYTTICIIFTMLVLMGLSDGATHSSAPAPSPHSGHKKSSGPAAPPPHPSHKKLSGPAASPRSTHKHSGTSVGADFSPHLLISLISTSLLFILPLCYSFFH